MISSRNPQHVLNGAVGPTRNAMTCKSCGVNNPECSGFCGTCGSKLNLHSAPATKSSRHKLVLATVGFLLVGAIASGIWFFELRHLQKVNAPKIRDLPQPVAQPSSRDAVVDNWRVEHVRDAMYGNESVNISEYAENGTDQLRISCSSGILDTLEFNVNSDVLDAHTVDGTLTVSLTSRFDDEQPQDEQWYVVDGPQSIARSPQPSAFFNRLLASNSLLVRVRTFKFGYVDLNFSLTGLRQVLDAPTASACGISKIEQTDVAGQHPSRDEKKPTATASASTITPEDLQIMKAMFYVETGRTKLPDASPLPDSTGVLTELTTAPISPGAPVQCIVCPPVLKIDDLIFRAADLVGKLVQVNPESSDLLQERVAFVRTIDSKNIMARLGGKGALGRDFIIQAARDFDLHEDQDGINNLISRGFKAESLGNVELPNGSTVPAIRVWMWLPLPYAN